MTQLYTLQAALKMRPCGQGYGCASTTGRVSPDASALALALARAAGELLRNLSTIPGQVEQDVDFNALSSWCNEVRRQAISHNRATVTDLSIGRWLAHSPPSGEDGAWPHQSVRRVLEESAATNIERGIQTGRINMRGVFSRKLGEGGEQERGLAEQYRSWASAMSQYPRTAAMLAAIAESWVRQGKEADLRAAQQELRG